MVMPESEIKRKRQHSMKGKHYALSGRMLRFCALMASEKSAKDAWIEAGYSSTNYCGAMNRMLRRADIQAKIAEHRARFAVKFEITVENVYQRLDRAYHGAMRKQDYASAVAASLGIARIGGLLIDRVSVEHQLVVRPARAPTPKEIELSIEEWKERFKPKLLMGNGHDPAAEAKG
jgi:hypothetical protein